ncbi:MAG TPA: hypothetical protein VL003_03540 [Pusillimonas sp.]|uniref:hypothetical protein n=1 Tax=Pusillimonas sp. TaxID=3040095 RepID=UPI002BDF0C60|nr:hypothetical protein [Pusillimonas sp.]HUH87107.1 hypothetical protein [Pusillimonas sp.]
MNKRIAPAPGLYRLRRRLFHFAVWCSVGLAAFGFASAAPHKQAILRGDFQETISQNVLLSGLFSERRRLATMGGAVVGSVVSGNPGMVIVGVSDGALDGTHIQSLNIAVGKHRPPPEVCLTVLTRDGDYWANNQYELPADAVAGDVVLLPYEKSRHLRVLQSYADTEIAVMASSGLCDAPSGEALLIGHAGSSRTHVRLYINSSGATDVYASFPDRDRVACKATGQTRFRYDYICTLEWPANQKGGAKITVIREQYGQDMPEASVVVVRGAP